MGIFQLFGTKNRIDVNNQNPIYTVNPGSSVKNVFKKQGALTVDELKAKKEAIGKYRKHVQDIENAQRNSQPFHGQPRPLSKEQIAIVKDRVSLSRYKEYVNNGMDENAAHQLVYGKNGSKSSSTVDEFLTKGKKVVDGTSEYLDGLSKEVKAAMNAMPSIVKNARWAAAAGAGVAGTAWLGSKVLPENVQSNGIISSAMVGGGLSLARHGLIAAGEAALKSPKLGAAQGVIESLHGGLKSKTAAAAVLGLTAYNAANINL